MSNIKQLRRKLKGLEANLNLKKRMDNFDPDVLQSEIQQWQDVVLEVHADLQPLLSEDQKEELDKLLIHYCKSNELPALADDLGLELDEAEE